MEKQPIQESRKFISQQQINPPIRTIYSELKHSIQKNARLCCIVQCISQYMRFISAHAPMFLHEGRRSLSTRSSRSTGQHPFIRICDQFLFLALQLLRADFLLPFKAELLHHELKLFLAAVQCEVAYECLERRDILDERRKPSSLITIGDTSNWRHEVLFKAT